MSVTIHHDKAENIASILPAESVQCVVTSPPYYGLRDYGAEGQIGLEETPEEYVAKLVDVFREVRKVLRPDGTLWLNLGDSYASGGRAGYDKDSKHPGAREGSHRAPMPSWAKPKDLLGIPWRVAFALQADGWYLRSDIIWHKPNPMPESVTDRPTKAHEYVFLLTKEPRYYYDADAIREPHKTASNVRNPRSESYGQARVARPRGGGPVGDGYREFNHPLGRNKRSVWAIVTQPFPEAHFATFPERLPELCILAGSPSRACPHCGAPWARATERMETDWDGSRYAERAVAATGGAITGGTKHSTLGSITPRVTTGWQPTCGCSENDGSGRSLVLDPFVGSGTTLLVAERLGRRAVGTEINRDYIEIAERRLSQVQLSMDLEGAS